MAAAEATLTEVLTADAYDKLDVGEQVAARPLRRDHRAVRPPCYTRGMGAKGCVVFSAEPLREYRDYLTKVDDDLSDLAWLYHMNHGVFMTPGLEEEWTISVPTPRRTCRASSRRSRPSRATSRRRRSPPPAGCGSSRARPWP